ncbi:EamA family transporter [Prolixibacter sp. SD074]|jgi:drug/metabolite transporter (DMT)-like permease|uniref:EamA family transporter n=1 Tax=Prolixibacter sp. SD074 TaxID=2652391 RepID=UPI00127EAB54|nr:EamA family transporter [Prolixibacter sp. SD074]GET30686.1 permease [Prolixibacter sp. SD074]
MWAIFGAISSLFLGTYDVLKKWSLRGNAVIPVLFFSTVTSALLFVPLLLLSHFAPGTFGHSLFFVPSIPIEQHGFIFLKAMIVTSSWLFAYFAMKNLPITIVTPIRATGPVWTLVGAIVIYSEHLSPLQWVGLSVTLIFFYLFSLAGKTEGIHFRTNKWVLFIIAGTLLGAVSGLYDKFLIRHFDRMAVQAWFSIYQVALLLPVLLFLWYPRRKKNTPFRWRWSIPFIGLFLVTADFLYFYALSLDGSLISVISALRRGGVLITFALGAVLFREKNIRQKFVLLFGILAGILLLLLGS